MKRIIPIIILIAIMGAGYRWYSNQKIASESNGNELIGSGSIEANSLKITAELGGQIESILVAEGDWVEAGQPLIELDKSDLLARQAQLETMIGLAEANLRLVSAPPRPESVRLAENQLAQAEQTRLGAEQVWWQTQQLANDPLALAAQINQAKAQVSQAEQQLDLAQVNLKRAEIAAEAASRNQSDNVGLAQNEAAQHQLQAAQEQLGVLQTALLGAHKQVELLTQLHDNPLALIAQVNAAQAAYRQTQAAEKVAQANLLTVKAGSTAEDINIARAQLEQAQAGLNVLAVQLAKQTISAPQAGLVSQKLINPGELARPGALLLQLNDLETVDLTVYIPETQIGRVQLNQKANVLVDAYPNQVFEGRVSFIAHQAEFTPRNVQTQEERVNLVFAVKITLDNPDHRLKPGMPADAEILPELWPESSEILPAAFEPPPDRQPTATSVPSPTPVATPLPAGPTPTSGPGQRVEVLAWGLKVRRAPNINAQEFAHLSQGDVVPVLQVDPASGWLEVELPSGQTGWITNNPSYVKMWLSETTELDAGAR